MFSESIRGPGMIGLQILRGCNIITLLCAAVACWTLIVKIDTSNGFFFFDAASLFFTSTISVFLVVSELPLAKSYFRRTWPVLSNEYGFTWLGVAMNVIGCNILGKLNQPTNSSKNLGLPFWRLVLASGILAITFGLFNIVASFVFGDSANGISARIVRSEGSLASADSVKVPSYKEQYSVRSNSVKEKPKKAFKFAFWGNKDDSPKAGSPRLPAISNPIPSHEFHSQHDAAHNPSYSPKYNQGTSPSGNSYEWDRTSPVVPGMIRPPSHAHPANAKYNPPADNHYSVARMSRFTNYGQV